LGTQVIVREPLDKEAMQEGSLLDIKQQLQIIAPFSEKDIKEAMFSIHPMMSPGPDGYSSSFFREAWADIGPKIYRAFREFFTT